mmetsp:Transcript_9191/g.27735  ORF Transcript_9191/g.27735 Transcript_9191/m.27735 type:complete len:251 (-) Transcript_9191:74-826(-)
MAAAAPHGRNSIHTVGLRCAFERRFREELRGVDASAPPLLTNPRRRRVRPAASKRRGSGVVAGRSRRVLRVPGPHGGPCAPQHQAGARAGRRSRARRRALRGDTEPVFSSDGLARGAEDGSEPERGPVPQGKGAGRGLDHARHAPLPRDDAVRVRVRRTPGQGRLPGPPPVGRHSPERRDEALLGVVHGKTRARLLLDQRRDARRARVGHGVGRLLHEPPRRGRRRRLLDVTRRRRPQASVRSNPRVEVR